ncbi:transmembrane protein 273 [Lemur catta]|uniref:transmembrane protein 273 n=1 Tax=Lemur catta TaxID=9447 RepID=UPI001E267139|nr:transmembrane protein 273 [Lemur catta]
MGPGASALRAVLLLLDVGGAQVLATGKSAGAEIDIKYALIGASLGVAIAAGFLALKICMIRRHLFDDYSSDLRSTHQVPNGEGPAREGTVAQAASQREALRGPPWHWLEKDQACSPRAQQPTGDAVPLLCPRLSLRLLLSPLSLCLCLSASLCTFHSALSIPEN